MPWSDQCRLPFPQRRVDRSGLSGGVDRVRSCPCEAATEMDKRADCRTADDDLFVYLGRRKKFTELTEGSGTTMDAGWKGVFDVSVV